LDDRETVKLKLKMVLKQWGKWAEDQTTCNLEAWRMDWLSYELYWRLFWTNLTPAQRNVIAMSIDGGNMKDIVERTGKGYEAIKKSRQRAVDRTTDGVLSHFTLVKGGKSL